MSVKIISGPEWSPLQVQEGLSAKRKQEAFAKEIDEFNGKVFSTELELPVDEMYTLYHFGKYFVHVHPDVLARFNEKFAPFLEKDQLTYDNLINVCIMVKNAGEGFRDILIKNLPYMDRYTILDTGSTDNTIPVIKEVLAHKRGELYEEPFINFRDSRNRLLELAGDHSHFNVMIDDSYVLHGKVREFLDFARGDDVVDSYSLVIEDRDTMYSSNRVTKPPRGLRYVNEVHEIIQTNLNVSIPYEWGHIEDINSDYMAGRTKTRKQKDIDTLMTMLEEDPDQARTYYYIADSYLCMKDWENAHKWFMKRAEKEGYGGEVQDSLYYVSVLRDMYLGYPWEQCHDWYLKCYEADPARAESLYFVGSHYRKKGMNQIAFMYMKKAYDLGMPAIQMSVRKNIYKFHIPKDLTPLCYDLGEYKLGEEAARKALEWQDDTLTNNWLHVMYHINKSDFTKVKSRICPEKVIAFVSPGGWNKWDGETLRTRGLGGSENFTIRYAEHFVKMGYKVAVFCNCEEQKEYEGVTYLALELYSEFISKYVVDVVLINRFCEYIAVSALHGIKTYHVMHDTPKEEDIIVLHQNLAGTLCISEWHKQRFLQYYPSCTSRTQVISYGLDVANYPQLEKEKYMFIYPNFPNRGLLQLLHMWPWIVEKYPQAHLHTFVNTQNEWCQKYWKDNMYEIDQLFKLHQDSVTNHGWVNGSTLREYWAKAHIWFYPCTFEETCVTGDTKIHTRTGCYNIRDLVGKEVEIFNGEQWSQVIPFLAKETDNFMKITFSDGSIVKVTPDHEFSVCIKSQRWFPDKYKKVRADQLKVGLYLPKFELGGCEGGENNELAYTLGAFTGDGYMDKDYAMLCCVEDYHELFFSHCHIHSFHMMWKDSQRKKSMYRARVIKGDFTDWKDLRNYETGLPDRIMNFSKKSILEYVAGWIDTDGSIRNKGRTSEGFIICGGFEQKLRDLQILLRRAGINFSTLRLQNKIGEKTSYGTRKKNIWVLQIPTFECIEIPTKLKKITSCGPRYIVNHLNINKPAMDTSKRQYITNIEYCSGTEPSYCFSEPLKNMGVFGNVLTYQCCLTAWEAAASRTLAVTNHLAALEESVGDRGVIIPGNANESQWHDKALARLFEVIDNNSEHEYTDLNYEWICTKNVPAVVEDFARRFIE